MVGDFGLVPRVEFRDAMIGRVDGLREVAQLPHRVKVELGGEGEHLPIVSNCLRPTCKIHQIN